MTRPSLCAYDRERDLHRHRQSVTGLSEWARDPPRLSRNAQQPDRDGLLIPGSMFAMALLGSGVDLSQSLFFDNTNHFDPDEDDRGDDDEGFVEAEVFSAPELGNLVDEDPLLGAPYDLSAPQFVPDAGSPAADAPAPGG